MPQEAGKPVYTIIDLGPLDGLVQTNGINASGVVVGVHWQANDMRSLQAFRWDRGEMTLLAEPLSAAQGINDSGQVVGQARTREGRPYACVWESNGRITHLDSLGGKFSGARAINNRSEIVGFVATPNGQETACRWREGRITDLGMLPGHCSSRAEAIHNSGLIVGVSEREDGQPYAVVWEGDAIRQLEGASGVAVAVNSAGQIVGAVSFPVEEGTGGHACLWQKGQVYDLGTLPGGVNSNARAINSAGDIVGSSGNRCSDSRACLWRGGMLYDLNDLIPAASGWELRWASGINDLGWIVGTGWREGQRRGYLLNPI